MLPARLVADIVRSLPPGEVEVAVDERRGEHHRRAVAVPLRPLSLDDYPAAVRPPADAVTSPAAAFGEALRQVVRAASTDEARPILTGVLLAAEDDGLRHGGHRLVPARGARPRRSTRCSAAGQKVLVPGGR